MTTDSPAQAFVEPPAEVAGLKLRPLTMGTLILLKATDNKLITGTADNNGLELEVAAFLYIHAADPLAVRRAAKSADAFRDAVLAFADTLSVGEFTAAATQIQEIITAATVGMNYQVEDNGEQPPNLSARVG
jgi:hypothetical protein